ncbi:hypothetical protein [Psychrobacter sp. DM4]|uniref:hypothetical protein n=1 Tax=Psychrobacter sp. DM4 TaxID=3440637 RepID=UPI003F4FC672
MSILIGIGVAGTVATIYLGRKGWHALHKAVGITPGVLTYHDSQTPRLLNQARWQQLKLNKEHLSCLPNSQLSQLQRIDNKVANFDNYQQSMQKQNITPAISESQFIVNKLLQTRLPEMLASYYHLMTMDGYTNTNRYERHNEASELLQQVLDNIETRLDSLLKSVERQHLQDLKVMKNYVDSQNV